MLEFDFLNDIVVLRVRYEKLQDLFVRHKRSAFVWEIVTRKAHGLNRQIGSTNINRITSSILKYLFV